jgi:predicted peptidase
MLPLRFGPRLALLVGIFLGLLAPGPAAAQPGFVGMPFTVDGADRTAALWVPAGYDRTQRWPLIVYLHGNGIQGDNQGRLSDEWLDSLFIARVLMRDADAIPALVLIPRCPEGATWAPRSAVPGAPADQARPPRDDAIAHIDAAVDEVLNRFPVDLDRIMLSGFSMGGHGSLRYGELRSNRFAGLAARAGAVVPDEARALAETGLPLWVFQGAVDPVVPVERVREMMRVLRSAGADPRYTEYADLGHQIVERAYAEPAFLDWLLSQRRSTR